MHTVIQPPEAGTPEGSVIMSVKVDLLQMGDQRETLRQFLRLLKCEDVIGMDDATVELRYPLLLQAGRPSDDSAASHLSPDDPAGCQYSKCKGIFIFGERQAI